MEEFIPGRPNQDLFALLKDQVTVNWMSHLDLDQTVNLLPLRGNLIAIDRQFVKPGEN